MDLEASEGSSTAPAELPEPQPVPASLPPQQEGGQDAVAHPPAVSAAFSSQNTPTEVDTNTTAPAPGAAISAVGPAPEVSSVTTPSADMVEEIRGGGGENGEAGTAAGAVKDEPGTEGGGGGGGGAGGGGGGKEGGSRPAKRPRDVPLPVSDGRNLGTLRHGVLECSRRLQGRCSDLWIFDTRSTALSTCTAAAVQSRL